ncbi:MAG: hypothetical protein P8179_07695 [Candidatus Thiodiazotropha sp.]
MGCIVGIADHGTIGLGDLGQVTGWIVDISGRAGCLPIAKTLLGQATPEVIAQGGGQAVGIAYRQRATSSIVGRNLGGVAQGVCDLIAVALGIVGVGCDVIDIHPGAVEGLDLALGGVGVADTVIGLGTKGYDQAEA